MGLSQALFPTVLCGACHGAGGTASSRGRSSRQQRQLGAGQTLQLLQSSPLFAPVVSSKAGTKQQTHHLVSFGIAQLKENRKAPPGTEPSQ